MALVQPAREGRELVGGRLALTLVLMLVATGCGTATSPSPPATATLAPWVDDWPHEDPALEGRLPRSAGGLELITWSARGEHALDMGSREHLTAALTRLGKTPEQLSMAFAGRSAPTDPRNYTVAYRVEGSSGAEWIGATLDLLGVAEEELGEARTVEGRSVRIAYYDATGEHVINYVTPDAWFEVTALTQEAALDMLGQIDR